MIIKNKIILIFIGALIVFNILAWRDVFALEGPHYLRVDYLDVGQGDSIFIETPEHHQILIDGGPNSSILGKLSERMPIWDKALDLVILTHPEKDHMQGLFSVLKKYKVDYVLWSGVKKSEAEYGEWISVLKNAQNQGTKLIIAAKNQEIKAGDILIDTLYPPENLEGKEIKNTSNDTCVVSKLIYNKKSFLFTGDAAFKTENDLISQKIDVKSDVLKVAHHGSKYSTSENFLKNVNPEIAVISVGKNSYGHPTSEVLQRLNNFGIKIFRTDQDGDIEILSDGENIKVVK